ncbi:hypothetical protein BpHYR1_017368 [Brachionus plicatilis]|uniref:Uncharacterized protein n=1 Tax=Brachionus plicatilis TaxID=10195 RepID=A0A3M7QVP9_BRAPC|nr:hypothetical protein BpHYR1_017368 [Brachionus plicatilis]
MESYKCNKKRSKRFFRQELESPTQLIENSGGCFFSKRGLWLPFLPSCTSPHQNSSTIHFTILPIYSYQFGDLLGQSNRLTLNDFMTFKQLWLQLNHHQD